MLHHEFMVQAHAFGSLNRKWEVAMPGARLQLAKHKHGLVSAGSGIDKRLQLGVSVGAAD